MQIIEIKALDNGAHRNQNIDINMAVPEGYALIPDCLAIPKSFPFVDIEVETLHGVKTVVSMTERDVPVQTPAEEPHTAQDDTDAMLIDQEYRLTLLELGVNG